MSHLLRNSDPCSLIAWNLWKYYLWRILEFWPCSVLFFFSFSWLGTGRPDLLNAMCNLTDMTNPSDCSESFMGSSVFRAGAQVNRLGEVQVPLNLGNLKSINIIPVSRRASPKAGWSWKDSHLLKWVWVEHISEQVSTIMLARNITFQWGTSGNQMTELGNRD